MGKPNKFDGLMHELCIGNGFCGSLIDGKPSHVTDYIPAGGVVAADQFAMWVLTAERLDPNSPTWRGKIAKMFVKHMGSDEVDAKLLRWG